MRYMRRIGIDLPELIQYYPPTSRTTEFVSNESISPLKDNEIESLGNVDHHIIAPRPVIPETQWKVISCKYHTSSYRCNSSVTSPAAYIR